MSDIKKFAGDLEVVKGKARELYQSFNYSDLESAVDYINDALSNIRQWERDVDALGDDIETIIEELPAEDVPAEPKMMETNDWTMDVAIVQALNQDDYVLHLKTISNQYTNFWKRLCFLMRDGTYEAVYKISTFLTEYEKTA